MTQTLKFLFEDVITVLSLILYLCTVNGRQTAEVYVIGRLE